MAKLIIDTGLPEDTEFEDLLVLWVDDEIKRKYPSVILDEVVTCPITIFLIGRCDQLEAIGKGLLEFLKENDKDTSHFKTSGELEPVDTQRQYEVDLTIRKLLITCYRSTVYAANKLPQVRDLLLELFAEDANGPCSADIYPWTPEVNKEDYEEI